ncbi:MAG: selenocysteine-specific translation elongation factor [Archangium sp.]
MILGTAGHVDHGKTSLVKALTGVDTDRLPEEKRRGITLELGFAQLTLPDGRTLGVIDVPGHERFVKAMAAGAGGVDIAMLVVSADEGVMPQTREHLDICTLLGVRRGVLVVTKSDLLPGLGDGWLELLEADLRSLVAGSCFEGAAMISVSAKSGEGLDALRAELSRVARQLEAEPSSARSADAPLFCPVDRAFTVKGFGLVVTGTLWSGRLTTRDAVALLPGLPGPLRVRGLQVHGKAVESVGPGQRVAVNLPELELAQVHRGQALARAGELTEARALDVELTLLPSVETPLPRRSRRLVTVGTAQVEAVVKLLDVDALRPGERCFAQLRTAAPVAALPGQRFIVRGTSAVAGRGATIAGGRVLQVNAPRRRGGASARVQALAEAPLEERLQLLLTEVGYAGLELPALFAQAQAPQKEVTKALERASAKGRVVLVDREARRYVSAEVFAGLSSRALSRLEAFHCEFPERSGVPREELRERLGSAPERVFSRVVATLLEAKRIEVVDEVLRLPGRGRAWTEQTAALQSQLTKLLEARGLQPPTSTELAAILKFPEARVLSVAQSLVEQGVAVRSGELFFAKSAIAALEARMRTHFETNERLSTQQFKELTGLSRKFLIPLAEYFDRERVTLRVGDDRVLRRS